jgi:hypothetical protein
LRSAFKQMRRFSMLEPEFGEALLSQDVTSLDFSDEQVRPLA